MLIDVYLKDDVICFETCQLDERGTVTSMKLTKVENASKESIDMIKRVLGGFSLEDKRQVLGKPHTIIEEYNRNKF